MTVYTGVLGRQASRLGAFILARGLEQQAAIAALSTGTNDPYTGSRPGTYRADDWDWSDTKRYWELQGVKVRSPYEAEAAARAAERAARELAETKDPLAETPRRAEAQLAGVVAKILANPMYASARPKARAAPAVQLPSIRVTLGVLSAEGRDWRDDDLMLAALNAASEEDD